MAAVELSAIAALLLLAIFHYLFRANARGGGVPRWFIYLVIGAPLVYAVATVLYALDAIDIADEFASGTPIRGEAGDDRARDLSDIERPAGGHLQPPARSGWRSCS